MQALVAASCLSSLLAPSAMISRRGAAAALFSLPALALQPRSASAGLFGDDGPQGELRELMASQDRLNDLLGQLESKKLQGDNPDDAIVVLQTLTIQLGSTASQLTKTVAAMPKLDASDAAKARELSARWSAELEQVRQGCRESSGEKQIAGVQAAKATLSQFFDVAATKYSLPVVEAPLSYSTDKREFAKQYFGIFSCEGQGLERVPGSNSCIESKVDRNINPIPTKRLLDFDFLTGEKLTK
jgi:hypothetical protein